jgi:hypothetical protein
MKRRKTTKKWLDKERQIILEDIKRAYNKIINRNTRWNEREYEDKRREAHKILRGGEYCLNQRWSKWILLIITRKERNFIKKWTVW